MRRAPLSSSTVTACRSVVRAPVCLSVVFLLLAACQPQARRLLLLDLALSDPVALNGTARPWHDAGYTVEYRRYYPHLTRADLERYHAVVFLFGREPEGPSDALTVGDVAILNEWVGRGSVVVLGYAGDGEGFLDRWIANRWLASQGAGITIGDWVLEDTTVRTAASWRPEPWAEAQPVGDEPLGSVYAPFPFDRNHVVVARDKSQLLAATSRHAFVRSPKGPTARPHAGVAAAARIDDGLVVVLSRHALGGTDPQYRPTRTPFLPPQVLAETHDFLTALARWTRRPAEWAHVPPAARGVPLALEQAPLPVELEPPRLESPPGVTMSLLPLPADRQFALAGNVPDWIRQRGLRVLWAPLFVPREGRRIVRSPASLDSLVAFLDAGGFNLLAGDVDPEGADSARAPREERDAVRHAWSDAVSRLQPTSVAWVPAFDFGEAPARQPVVDSSRGARGEPLGVPCALDTALWLGRLTPAYTALGRLAADQRTLVVAVGLDFGAGRDSPEPGLGYSMGQEFCDVAWRHTLKRLGQQSALDSLPYAERYRTLREVGLLSLYYRALEEQVAERATALRDRVLRQRRDVYFAFRLPQLPADWFTLGMLRGFALPDRPLLLLSPEVQTRELTALYRARGLNAVHAVELVPALLRTRDWGGLRRAVFDENDGFWFPGEKASGGLGGPKPAAGRLSTDSLTRLVRRLAR